MFFMNTLDRRAPSTLWRRRRSKGNSLMNLSARMRAAVLLRDTTHLSIGQGFRLVIQAAYFVLVARSLGPDAYGAFVTVVAIAALLGPFSGLGTANLFIKNVRSGKRP